MSRYFYNFPKTAYNFADGAPIDIISNLTTKIGFSSEFKNDVAVYDDYLVSDGETPESIAFNIYDISERHWIILSYNDIMDPIFDWVIDTKSLHHLIDNKYSSSSYANTANTNVSGAQWAKANTKEYYKVITHTENTTNTKTENIIVINYSEYANITASSKNYTLTNGTKITTTVDRRAITYYDYETELNDKKRLIKLPKKQFINSIEREVEKLLKNE